MLTWLNRIGSRFRRKTDAASFHLLASLTDALAECVIGIRPDGTLGLWNPGAHRLTGYLSRDVLARPLENLFSLDHRPEIAALLRQVMGRGHSVFWSGPVHLQHGGTQRVGMTVTPLYASADRIAGAVAVLRVGEDSGPGSPVPGLASLPLYVQHVLQAQRTAQQRSQALETALDGPALHRDDASHPAGYDLRWRPKPEQASFSAMEVPWSATGFFLN